jgi:hypothetical protein
MIQSLELLRKLNEPLLAERKRLQSLKKRRQRRKEQREAIKSQKLTQKEIGQLPA